MKNEKLMIGDYIMIDGHPTKIDAIHLKKIGYHKREDRLEWVRIGCDNVKPIQLTNEIVSKLGFSIDTVDDVDGLIIDIAPNPLETYFVMIVDCSDELCIRGIKYYHQLQHIFDLFGIKWNFNIF